MHNQIKELAPRIKAEINKANRILVHLHPNSDSDAVGSSLALKLVLEEVGKQVDVIQGDTMPPIKMKFLEGFDKIFPQSFAQVNLNDYDLFIAMDSSSPNQVTDNISLEFPLSIPTIVIDHHITNTRYGDINLVISECPATSEILFWLFKKWEVKITPAVGTCLYTGIWGDTGGFRWEGTGESTFLAASELVRSGVDVSLVVFKLSAMSIPQLLLYGKMLGEIKTFYHSRVAMIKIAQQMLVDSGLVEDDYNEVLMATNGVLSTNLDSTLTSTIKEKEPGKVSVSIRNNNLDPDKQCDASEIATALGGGGHKRAAGIRFQDKTVDEVQEIILKKIIELHPEFGDR